jgi:very-short-patch-repair endonuclease
LEQTELIGDLLDKWCQTDAWLDAQLTVTEETAEPFFVKNLENVQGDERDVILVSTTYGPDPDTGRVYQRFGPISNDLGWRRLNVIFTRARKRLELFTSMRSSDLSLHSDANLGVRTLKAYLEYAETGELPDNTTVTHSATGQNNFVLAISKILQEHGYQTVPQVGVAGFRLDLGVCHPQRPDEYILGIECDGADYHSVLSIRDRDRLKPDLLTNKGWKIHRIWSTDWFKNREVEIERLLRALSKVHEVHNVRLEMKVEDVSD